MKNYDEIAEAVFARSEAIMEKKRGQRKAALRWGSLAVCLVLIVSLSFGFFGGKPAVDPSGTTAAPEKEIVLPPTRFGAVTSQLSLDRGYTLEEGALEADAVAWVRIGNWLGENTETTYFDDRLVPLNPRTYFEVEVIACYKGDLPDTFVFKQYGSSAETTLAYPLFTYGNEFLMFLKKSKTDFSYGECYFLIGDYATVLDVVEDESGVAYVSDRVGYMTNALKDTSKNYCGNSVLRNQLRTVAAVYDEIQGDVVFGSKALFKLADIVEIINGTEAE